MELNLEELVLVAIVVIVFSGIFGFTIIDNLHKETVTITVNEKLVKNGDKSSKYLIFTEGEIFENTDQWLRGKFDSSDLYAKLEIGKSYEVVVVGKRIRLFSMYRNILEVK